MESTTRSEDDDASPLPSPAELAAELPLSARAAATVADTRLAIRRLLHGADPQRLLVVVGPCSIHDREAAVEYAQGLRRIADDSREELVVVMRTYVEKPRTTLGWKGLVNDPGLDGSCDVARGLRLARSILSQVTDLGVACGSEILDPSTIPYLADLLAWGSIGARTVESQTHRVAASGVAFPIGLKNRTDGDVEPAADALAAIAAPHATIGIGADGRVARIRTRGNPDGHLVLRGGRGGPNASAEEIGRAARLGQSAGIARPVVVDCSHANSRKEPARQADVARGVLAARAAGESGILGLMLESHLRSGRQDFVPGGSLEYGVSVTDACLGWSETESILVEIAAAVREAGRDPASFGEPLRKQSAA